MSGSTPYYRQLMIQNYGKMNTDGYSATDYIKKYAATKIQRDIYRGFSGFEKWKPKGIVRKILNGTGITKLKKMTGIKSEKTVRSMSSLFKDKEKIAFSSTSAEELNTLKMKTPMSKMNATHKRIRKSTRNINFGNVEFDTAKGLQTKSISLTAKDIQKSIGKFDPSNVEYTGKKGLHRLFGKSDAFEMKSKINTSSTVTPKVAALLNSNNGFSYLEDMINVNYNATHAMPNLRIFTGAGGRGYLESATHSFESLKSNIPNNSTDFAKNAIKELREGIRADEKTALNAVEDATTSNGKKNIKSIKSQTKKNMNAVNNHRNDLRAFYENQGEATRIAQQNSSYTAAHNSLNEANKIADEIRKSPSTIATQKEAMAKMATDLQKTAGAEGLAVGKQALKKRRMAVLKNYGAKVMNVVATVQLAHIAATGIVKGVVSLSKTLEETAFEITNRGFGSSEIVTNQVSTRERQDALNTIALNHNANTQFIGGEATALARR